ncbi:MAG: hypothetical protein ACRDNY_14030 [Gaiellaceae bacterium]
MSAGILMTPRPVPSRLLPALAGTAVIVLALPLFAIAGWPLEGWAFAAVLWVGAQALAALLTRLPLGASNLAAVGMRGVGTSFRAFAVGVPLVVLTLTNESVGAAALAVYVLAFTLELVLSLVTYFGGEARA